MPDCLQENPAITCNKLAFRGKKKSFSFIAQFYSKRNLHLFCIFNPHSNILREAQQRRKGNWRPRIYAEPRVHISPNTLQLGWGHMTEPRSMECKQEWCVSPAGQAHGMCHTATPFHEAYRLDMEEPRDGRSPSPWMPTWKCALQTPDVIPGLTHKKLTFNVLSRGNIQTVPAISFLLQQLGCLSRDIWTLTWGADIARTKTCRTGLAHLVTGREETAIGKTGDLLLHQRDTCWHFYLGWPGRNSCTFRTKPLAEVGYPCLKLEQGNAEQRGKPGRECQPCQQKWMEEGFQNWSPEGWRGLLF